VPQSYSALSFIPIHIELAGGQGRDSTDVLLTELHDEIDILRKTRQSMDRACHRSDRKIFYAKIVENMKQRRQRFIHPASPRKPV